MNHHKALWKSVEYIAQINNISCACLAYRCGLDSNTFNPSKRLTRYGQPRWISTETLYKVLKHTNTSPAQFAEIFQSFLDNKRPQLI